MVVNDESDPSGKEKKKNRNRKTQAKVEKPSNNQRRSDSESNVKKVSKGGGGSRNWGNDIEEARKASKGEKDDEVVDDFDNDDEDSEKEPEPITFTLEEYMAQKAGEKKDEKLFGAFKERAVDSKVDGRRVNDVGLDNYLVVGGLKENKQSKEKKERKTQVITVDLLSTPQPSQSVFQGDRRSNNDNYGNRSGDRGSGRGGRGGRGRGRGGYSLDASAFPSL